MSAGWPDDLHYDAGRLARLALIGLALAVVAGSVALAPAWIADAGGVPGKLVGLIGVTATRGLIGTMAVVAFGFSLAYARLAWSGDRVAAHADADGVVLRTLLGTRRHGWLAITAVSTERIGTATREIILLRLVTRDVRSRGLASNALVEAGAFVEGWAQIVSDLAAAERVRADR